MPTSSHAKLIPPHACKDDRMSILFLHPKAKEVHTLPKTIYQAPHHKELDPQALVRMKNDVKTRVAALVLNNVSPRLETTIDVTLPRKEATINVDEAIQEYDHRLQ